MTLTYQKNRSKFLDEAKAIAIILMVLLHTTPRYENLSNIVGSFHMAVFFLISGVFFSTKGRGFSEILRKSITQLIIPYLCFSLIALSICWISPYLHPEMYPGLNGFPRIFKAAILGILVGQDYYNGHAFMPLGPLWFLLALFWCRLAMFIWAFDTKYHYVGKIFIVASIIYIYISAFIFVTDWDGCLISILCDGLLS